MPFCLCGKDLGIAEDGTFAATAWRISDELFNSTGGNKFSWLAPDGKIYIDNCNRFKRPTEDQIRQYITPLIQKIAVAQGLIEP